MLGVLPLNFFNELHRAGEVEVAVLQQGRLEGEGKVFGPFGERQEHWGGGERYLDHLVSVEEGGGIGGFDLRP